MTPVEHCGLGGERRFGADQPVGRHVERAPARRRHARRLGRIRTSVTPKRGFTGSKAVRALIIMRTTMPRRRERVARDPLGEPQRDRRQRRHVEARGDRLELLGIDGLAGVADGIVPHHADAALRPERDQHEAAGLQLEPVRHQVVVGLVERDRQQDGHAGAHVRLTSLELIQQAVQTGGLEENRKDQILLARYGEPRACWKYGAARCESPQRLWLADTTD